MATNNSVNSMLGSLDNTSDDTATQLQNILNGKTTTGETKNNDDVVVVKAPKKDASVESSEVLSPLEKLKQDKNSGKITSGLVVNDDDLKNDDNPDDKVISVMNDERVAEWDEYLDNMDKTIEHRKYVTLVRSPKTQMEYMNMMDEVSSVKVKDDGTAVIDYRDKDGNPIPTHYIRLRKEGEPEFDFSPLKNADSTEKMNPLAPPMNTPVATDEETTNDVGVSNNEAGNTTNESPAKTNEIEVIIDKTGLGVDFAFTEEERAKLRASDVIRVREVHDEDIKTVISKRNHKSFSDYVGAFAGDSMATLVPLPASGMKVRMKSMSYGEYSDVALSMDSIDFDLYRKRLSVLYNNMIDISHGPFESFEDFLKNIAYTDIDLAMYAMFVSTQTETEEIQLRCGNEACKQAFDWKFLTRSVLRLDRCPDVMINKMEELTTSAPADFDAIYEKAPVRTTKTIELPVSKILAEVGIGSAYHFLYNFVPVLDEDTFINTFGDEASIEVHLGNATLLPTLLKVYVPDGSGEFYECETYKDILNAIYSLPPRDMQILMAYCAKIRDDYSPVFSLGKVKCPHCNTVTDNLDISIDTLVFRMYQRLISTGISLENIVEV